MKKKSFFSHVKLCIVWLTCCYRSTFKSFESSLPFVFNAERDIVEISVLTKQIRSWNSFQRAWSIYTENLSGHIFPWAAKLYNRLVYHHSSSHLEKH